MPDPGRSRRRLAVGPSVTGLELGGRPARPAVDVPVSLAERIAAAELQLAALRREQAGALLVAIAGAVPIDFAFCAHELFDHRHVSAGLAEAFAEAGVTSPRRLGKTLERLQRLSTLPVRLERLGVDYLGVVWMLRDTLR